MHINTADQVREFLKDRGLTVSEWARYKGYSPSLVYQVLSGRIKCERGISHDIAVQLGLKVGKIRNLEELDFTNIPADAEEVFLKKERNPNTK